MRMSGCSGLLEIRVPDAVALEGGAGGVEGEAVDLDDEALGGPEEVDFVACDFLVRVWRWETRRSDQFEEETLRLRSRERWVGRDRLSECGGSSVAGVRWTCSLRE